MSKSTSTAKESKTRIPIVSFDKCQPATCGHACIKICPLNKKGRKVVYADNVTKKARIDSKKCIACGICVNKCPTHAIAMVGLPVELREEPIHQYDENAFRLYGLPFLAKGKVAGLIGANGIGKTTVLNILAGKLVPNGGNYELTNQTLRSMLNSLNLSVHRAYFNLLASCKVNVSYKEQVLTQYLKEEDSLGEILSREDELGIMKDLADELQLTNLLDKNYGKLSGGERQRFSIAVALSKDADVYLIDEPGNFLDIKQRLKLAKLFQNLADQDKIVLVVEHDIAILDYLSDQIQALWGTPHAFGVVSGVKGVKNGINAYLTGHLKEENITFRSKEISFLRVVKERRWETVPVLVKFTTLWKSFDDDNFKLKVLPGEVHKGETIVILGENGIGKTTFVKMLAGELKPNRGSADVMAQVSYKPQFITRDYKGTVDEFISNYSNRYTGEQVLKQTFYQPLGIEHLFDKQVNDLSGGELQRIYIAACLTKRADLYLIDEPAAFLDVEERIKVARIIRNAASLYNASVIAIEHDMQLADVLGDRVMLFLGEPGKRGYTVGPMGKREGMNEFLKTLNITFRRDAETGRARINKSGSKIDREQRESGEFFFDRS
ncbi:MAG TPA: ribosome biogenesis/translation initiation ATPase RLI [Candidatus Bathyarchaeia archaeon]|nr:ribosome biogenesis/translation initiation ATPase RLI [Candidatus Bathyarchaeia archaeon]